LCLVIVEDLWELYSKHNSSLTAGTVSGWCPR
jgi:hypothetical protein